MPASDLIFLSVATFVASAISAAIGFGSAILLIPAFALLLPFKQAIAVLSVYFIVVTSARAAVFREHIEWRTVGHITLGAIPASVLGIAVLLRAEGSGLKALLSITILLFLLSEALGIARRMKLSISPRGTVAIGAAYGLFNGMIGTGNVITASLLIHLGFRKEAFVGTMATCSIALDILKVAVLGHEGFLTLADAPLVVSTCVLGVLGTWAGKPLVQRLSAEHFRHAVMFMLLVVSVRLLVS